MLIRHTLAVALCLILVQACTPAGFNFHHSDPANLEAWNLMRVTNRQLVLGIDVVPYQLNATLFTDYAHKLRTISLPEGLLATINNDGTINFPVGTVISKTFFYPENSAGLLKVADNGDSFDAAIGTNGGLDLSSYHLIETRILVHRKSGWAALPYVWNEAQTSAVLEVTGDLKKLELPAEDFGTFSYVIPDKNQCAGCHETNLAAKQLNPIGPKAANLNRLVRTPQGSINQLEYWAQLKLLSPLQEAQPIAPLVSWQDSTATLEARARAYLDVNCGHCHSETGPADTSGLFLDIATTSRVRLGRCKLPIAAGQGTGGNMYSIVPGEPDKSIMVYRMKATDPGAMMPELGRSLVHSEGVALISDWIEQLEGECG